MFYSKLPNNLIIDFNKMFNLKPDIRSNVLVYNKTTETHDEKTIFRSYNSYLLVPEFDREIKKSYMFLNKQSEVPDIFNQFVEFVKSVDNRYNQMVINWYNPEDYIQLHRDCNNKMIDPNSNILTINFNETDNIYNLRHLIFEDVKSTELSSIPLQNNHYYIINNNTTHRHGVGTGNEKRISLTFRMIKE